MSLRPVCTGRHTTADENVGPATKSRGNICKIALRR